MLRCLPVVTALLLAVVRAEPPNATAWRVVPEFTDEFDGTALDLTKWHPKNPEWPGHEPGWQLPRNVEVKDGRLQLCLRAENVPEMTAGYEDFTAAAVKSRHRIRYGWFEISARTGKSAGSSAFWLYHQTPDVWTEIDVFELTGNGKFSGIYHMNTPVIRKPGMAKALDFHGEWPLPWDPAVAFHTYALDWSAEKIRWLVDGKQVRELPNVHHVYPLHILLDTETLPHWFGLPAAADLPAVFAIDYIKVWQRRS